MLRNQPLRTVVTRLTADGPLDTDFGSNGYYVNAEFTACPSLSVLPRALAIDSAGRILVGGTCDWNSASSGCVAMARSTRRSAFPDSRMAASIRPAFSDEVDSIVFDRSGHPVIGGRSQLAGHGPQAGVARLTYDLIFVHDFETTPSGCLPPECN